MNDNISDSDRWVFVQGPRFGDAKFYGRWLLAAAEAQQLWEVASGDTDFAKRVDRLCIAFIPDFGIAAAKFLQLKSAFSTFIVPLEEEFGDDFANMLGMGFFVLTGNRYQMTVPSELTISIVNAAMLRYAETEDEQSYLHPEHLVRTMSYAEAKAWQRRLGSIDELHWVG